MRIVLIGYRGSGKSTVATLLSGQLHWPVVSTDNLIVRQIGRPIADFVREEGWPAFRKVESTVIAGIDPALQQIIDCGGGVIESPENMTCLTQESTVVWLNVPEQVVLERLVRAGDRPLLSESDMAGDVLINYRRRLPLYRRYADLELNTATRTPAQICRSITDFIANPS